jgi:hypothetical protein
MTPEQIDKIVCDWSITFGVTLTERQLNALVDKLALASAPKLSS